MSHLTSGKQLLNVKLPCISLHDLYSAVTVFLGQHYILCSNRAVSEAHCFPRLACTWLLHANKHYLYVNPKHHATLVFGSQEVASDL